MSNGEDQKPAPGTFFSDSSFFAKKTFTEIEKTDILKKLQGNEKTEQKTWEVTKREKAFDVFSNTLLPTLNVIYYPGPDSDISPSKTLSFKNSKIIYVDDNKSAIQALQKAGCDAHVANVKTFNPGPVDLLLLLNFYDEQPLTYVAENGYVICNKHWGGGIFPDMLKRKDFKFIGALVDTDDNVRFDRENLENYSKNPNYNSGKEDNLFVFRKLAGKQD